MFSASPSSEERENKVQRGVGKGDKITSSGEIRPAERCVVKPAITYQGKHGLLRPTECLKEGKYWLQRLCNLG